MIKSTIAVDYQDRINKPYGEFQYLVEKYNNISFNNRNWLQDNYGYNIGKQVLFPTEGHTTMPENYSEETMSKYKMILTHNTKFYNKYKNKFNMQLVNGPINTDNFWELSKDDFTTYDNKINGIVIMNNIYQPTCKDGCIMHLREEFVNKFTDDKDFSIDIYNPTKWGGKHWKGYPSSYGKLGGSKGNHEDNLKLLSKYKFSFCPEPIYHDMWSWDYLTERIFNSFKAKTIPIYYGCYNIEQHIPLDLFIDFRKFNFNYRALKEHLLTFDNAKYTETVEKAYEWNLTNRISNMDDLETILGKVNDI